MKNFLVVAKAFVFVVANHYSFKLAFFGLNYPNNAAVIAGAVVIVATLVVDALIGKATFAAWFHEEPKEAQPLN